jgi:hypothetical protein
MVATETPLKSLQADYPENGCKREEKSACQSSDCKGDKIPDDKIS